MESPWTGFGIPRNGVRSLLTVATLISILLVFSNFPVDARTAAKRQTITVTSPVGGEIDFKVRVVSTDVPQPAGSNGASFTIAACRMRMTQPNGGETWQAGTSRTISWERVGSPGETVRVDLIAGNVVIVNIAEAVPIGGSTGGLVWDIPAWIADGKNYRIRVVSDRGYWDDSDAPFTISAALIGLAGPDRNVSEPGGVNLVGSNSRRALQYHWEQVDGPAADIANPSAPDTMVNIDTEGSRLFKLTISGEPGSSSVRDTCMVNVSADNQAPVAGIAAVDFAKEGDEVSLDGSLSSDLESELTYRWTQVSGPGVLIGDSAAEITTFTARSGAPGI